MAEVTKKNNMISRVFISEKFSELSKIEGLCISPVTDLPIELVNTGEKGIKDGFWSKIKGKTDIESNHLNWNIEIGIKDGGNNSCYKRFMV